MEAPSGDPFLNARCLTQHDTLLDDVGGLRWIDVTDMSSLISSSPQFQITIGVTRQFHQIFTVYPLCVQMLMIVYSDITFVDK